MLHIFDNICYLGNLKNRCLSDEYDTEIPCCQPEWTQYYIRSMIISKTFGINKLFQTTYFSMTDHLENKCLINVVNIELKLMQIGGFGQWYSNPLRTVSYNPSCYISNCVVKLISVWNDDTENCKAWVW